ncbi:hypothetical protein [Nocardia aurantiaca]|uniref:Uncharacterized protein n=1 Tax=Nocardia aurantiaca TaxID=2675850 RepID=A0A6I3LC07_9NOCA|nr:hypothetical protein [Nocardia aurantiaca]MTE17379.1 hypothetical protein [Nocardia aurantiaca]
MITELVTTAATFTIIALYLAQTARRHFPSTRTPDHHSVAAIRARIEGEKRVAAASKHEAARLATQLTITT